MTRYGVNLFAFGHEQNMQWYFSIVNACFIFVVGECHTLRASLRQDKPSLLPGLHAYKHMKKLLLVVEDVVACTPKGNLLEYPKL